MSSCEHGNTNSGTFLSQSGAWDLKDGGNVWRIGKPFDWLDAKVSLG